MVNAKKGVEQIGGKKNEVSSYKKKNSPIIFIRFGYGDEGFSYVARADGMTRDDIMF